MLYLWTNYLTNCTEQSPSWEANRSQFRSCLHYMEPEGSLQCSHQPTTCPCAEPDQSSSHPSTLFFKIQSNIIFPSMPRFSKLSLSLRFQHQNPICISSVPHTCYISHPSNYFGFDLPNSSSWAVQIIKLLNVCSLQSPVASPLLGPIVLLSTFSSFVMYSFW